MYAFCYRRPEAWVFAMGSTPARTRLYQIGLNRFYTQVVEDFDLYGFQGTEWLSFQPNASYDAFVVQLKQPLT